MSFDFKRRSMIDSLTGGTHQWATGTGSIGIFTVNGGAAESERLYDTDPFGNESIVWQSNPAGDWGPSGGWNTSYLSMDYTKLYRFSVWIRRSSSATDPYSGKYYFGCTGSGNVLNSGDGAAQSNPYWDYRDTSGMTLNTWYLFVGHVFPRGYRTGTYGKPEHPDSGIYTVAGGKISGLEGNVGGEVVFGPSTTSIRHRSYHFYCVNTSAHLQFFDPRIELCDGSEGTVVSLLGRSSADGPGNVLSSRSITKDGSAIKHQKVVATGGNKIITFGDYKSHVFTGTSSFSLESYVGSALKVDYLIVAGGGGGGSRMGGGGGGGGVLAGYCYMKEGTGGGSYTATIGAGGAGNAGVTTWDGSDGGNSTFNGLTAIGGGGGGGGTNTEGGADGHDGGSGGGASGFNSGTPTGVGGSGTIGQGNDGGDQNGSYYPGSGGGGGTAGTSASSGVPCTGGTGTFSAILGRPYYWGAGGGGAPYNTAQGGAGGPGGGGGAAWGSPAAEGGKESINWGEDGSTGTFGGSGPGGDGGANSGGGGGGAAYSVGVGGDGGDGVVIIRYKYR